MVGDTYLQLLLRELDPPTAQPIADAEPAEAIALIEALAPQEMPVAHYAASALLELGPDAAPALDRWILAHGHAVLWATLSNNVDPAPGLETFGALLDVDDHEIVAAAAAAVGACGAAGLRYAARLRALAESGADSWLRSHALRALGQVGAKEIDVLFKAVREGEEEECHAAVVALGRLGADARESVDAICDCLDHEEPFIAVAAPIALTRIGERTARVGDALAAALERAEDPDRYEGLLHAIGRLGAPSPAARAALDEAGRAGNPGERGAAAVAGYLATGDRAGVLAGFPDAARFLLDWRVEPDAFAEAVLTELDRRAREGPPAGDQTIDRVVDPSAEIIMDVADELIALAQRVGDPNALPALERIAADPRCQPWTRDAATNAAKSLRREPGA